MGLRPLGSAGRPWTDPVNLTLRPIEAWPWKETASRGPSRFRSSWSAIEGLLKSEADKINGRTLILQIDVMERDIRLDGWIKAHAHPASPRVAITIERISSARVDRPTLTFHCDTFSDWQDNVFAIAKTLEALRSIDRYGVTSSGEQYTGWQAIPEKAGSDDEARAILWRWAATDWNPADLSASYKAARRRAHPDAGGTHDAFLAVQAAAQRLGVQ